MRQALLDSIRSRGERNLTANVPAPLGGWNTRDALAEMAPTDAPVLDNWFPRAGQCVLRGGSLDYSTGMTGAVKSTFQYSPTSGTKKLYGATDSGIYDCTAGGAVGAVAKAATNGYINTVNFANSAGTSYLWCCNGTDTPFYFDGAAWTNATITGVTAANLVWPVVFKHRIFAIEKNTMNLWYLPLDSIQGAALVLPYGNLFKLGGSLASAASWTLDAGDGPDDLLAVISTEGQLAVYKGTDPNSAASWAIVGVWFVGRPLGRRCFQQLGGDVLVLTENGAFPLSKILQSGTVNFATALSNKIQPTWSTTVKAQGFSTAGYEAVIYPQFDAMLINIPSVNSMGAQQFVMNTVTGAWCSFSGWDLLAQVVFNGQYYFSTAGGKLVKAWDGLLTGDNGNDIVTTCHPAYNYFGSKTKMKKISLFRWLFSFNASIQVSWGMSVDFSPVALTSTIARGGQQAGSLWDTVFWDSKYWDGTLLVFKNWRAASHAPGYALSLWLQTASNTSTLSWAGTDYILQGGSAM